MGTFIVLYFLKSTAEEGGRLTVLVTSQTKWNQVGQSPISIWPSQYEIAQGALWSQVLRSRDAAEAEENLTAKSTEFNFIPMSMRWKPSGPSGTQELLVCLWVDIRTGSIPLCKYTITTENLTTKIGVLKQRCYSAASELTLGLSLKVTLLEASYFSEFLFAKCCKIPLQMSAWPM